MTIDIDRDLNELRRLTTGQLQQRYADLFGEPVHTGNKTWLIKRLAWRMQAMAEGGLSERAGQRAAELARDADLRLSPPRRPCTQTLVLSPKAGNDSVSLSASRAEQTVHTVSLDQRGVASCASIVTNQLGSCSG